MAAMLLASAGSLVSGHDAIDRACAPALLAEHDHSAHRIGGEPEDAPEHCDACHLARTSRGTVAAHQLASTATLPGAALFLVHEPASRIDLLTDFTRGPPTL